GAGTPRPADRRWRRTARRRREADLPPRQNAGSGTPRSGRAWPRAGSSIAPCQNLFLFRSLEGEEDSGEHSRHATVLRFGRRVGLLELFAREVRELLQ